VRFSGVLAAAARERRRQVAAGVLTVGFAVLLVTGVFTPASAHAAVWTAPAGERVFPGTPAAKTQTIGLSLAGGEYEGAVVGLRGAKRAVRVTWSTDSDPFLIENAALHQVAFVRVRRPTTDTGARPGLYPDPILPRAFDASFSAPRGSSSLYVLFHAPYQTPAGEYRGTLQVENGSEAVAIAVRLHVHEFGWQRLSVRTGFSVNFQNLDGDVGGLYAMLLEHGVTPMMPKAVPPVSANGDIGAQTYAERLQRWLGDDGLALPSIRLPWLNWYPSFSWNLRGGDRRLLNYLTQVCRVIKEGGWAERAYGYPVDEPTSTALERQAEALARTLHTASARSGFRAKFLLTDDPRPTSLHPLLPANKFLWDDVDIWCVRYYYFFGRVPILRQLKARGADVWWYPYCNTAVARMPNFIIEKSLADQRVWGWQMYQWDVDGLLYWGVNRWGNAKTGKGNRDPYQDPLSYVYPDGRLCNGEAMLVYPGYYPRYGLKDRSAPPVSSLRLEALRDGFEDLEYLKLAAKVAGAKWARGVTKSITWYPGTPAYGHIFSYPRYVTAPSRYLSARAKLAAKIEQGQR
jgi:hypothetical protein